MFPIFLNFLLITYDANLPNEFDAREKWPFCTSIKQITDQGHKCGACWAISTASFISDRICIRSFGKINVEISAQDLLECCRKCKKPGSKDPCFGGDQYRALKHFYQIGIVSGGGYKSGKGCKPLSEETYRAGNVGYCTRECSNSNYSVPYKDDKHYGEDYYTVPPDVESIQKEIYKNGPVLTYYAVYQDFKKYTNGVYVYNVGDMISFHGVKIIGWGSEGDVPYWLVANSWGADWGISGFFKIKRGENMCEIEAHVLASAQNLTSFPTILFLIHFISALDYAI